MQDGQNPNQDTGDQWLDFRAIRESASFEQILAEIGVLPELRGQDSQRQGPCPIHESDSPESNAFSVNLERGIFNCFSCGAHGNVLDFVAAYHGIGLREAAIILRDNAQVNAQMKKHRSKPSEPQSHKNQPLDFKRRDGLTVIVDHPAVKEWGISDATIQAFGIGYSPYSRVVGGRVAVPIRNEHGQLLAYAGRAVTSEQEQAGKWKLPGGFIKSQVVFNLNRAKDYCSEQPVIVVEGFRAAIVLTDWGYQNTVALMGSSVSERQVELLAEHVKSGKALLMLDGDQPGKTATPKIAKSLRQRLSVSIITLPDDLQPDEVGPAKMADLVNAACLLS